MELGNEQSVHGLSEETQAKIVKRIKALGKADKHGLVSSEVLTPGERKILCLWQPQFELRSGDRRNNILTQPDILVDLLSQAMARY